MKRDVFRYFNSMQKDYNALLESKEKIDKQAEEGLLTQEQRQNFVDYFTVVQNNYQRISYIIYLLGLPPRFIQKIKEKKELKELYKRLEEAEATLEDVEEENKDALDKIDEIIEENEQCQE